MTRLPFDPRSVQVPPEEQVVSAPSGPLSVTQLTAMIKRVLDDHLPSTLHVIGEISNFKHHSSGHVYLTLKDAAAEIACVMWRSDAARLKFQPNDGMEVVATGRVDLWERAGKVQLYIRRLEPRGVGALELAFRQLCEKLETEGLFDPDRKKAIPAFPRCLAVVTSPTGAAIRDILKTLNRRFPCVRVLLHPVAVQGEGAAEEIAAAIRRLNAQAERLGGIDAMIVGRGGGSIEDLWAFNEEVVARAIAASRIPIISGVGHEVDTTIADLVADARAHTPTAAAEMAVPVLADVLETLDAMRSRLRRAMTAQLELARARLESIARHEWFRRPRERLGRLEQELDERQALLNLATLRMLDRFRRRVHAGETALARIRPDRLTGRLSERLARMARRLERVAVGGLTRRERHVAGLAERMARTTPQRLVEGGRTRLDQLQIRVGNALHNQIEVASATLSSLHARLDAINPGQVLRRGFSITRQGRDGRVITNPSQVRPGVVVRTETADGSFESQVIDPDQPTLF